MADPLDFTDKLKKEWFVIKGAPFSFAACCLIVACVLWGVFFFHYAGILESNKAQNDSQQAQIENLKTALNDAQKLNSTEPQMPLKLRTEILAHQLYEFSTTFAERNTNNSIRIPNWNTEYLTNFLERIENVRTEIEKSGLNTDGLAKSLANPDLSPVVTFEIAEELQKLSSNLK